ncbi:hypothetical protein BH10CYA1_BH10CYA1_40950 [soil metagenome]
MKFLAPVLVAASLTICASTVRAQVSETTTTTTTIESSAAPGVVLPGGITYNIVNPSTGVLLGPYSVGMSVPSGNYIIEQNTGRVLATTDASGRLIAFTSFPSVLPQRFLLVSGQMVYFNDDYAFRRAQLDQKITDEYAGGRLTNNQAKVLHEKLGYVANLVGKRKGDLSYRRSTIREIERKFADVQSLMAHDVADTNSRKARIGLRVD